MLDSRNLKIKRLSKKLDQKIYGPYTIIKLIGNHTVELKLPNSIKCYNVFYVLLLELYRESTIKGRQ